ncbi:MAG TPA: FKBP-type peptidyl-prolyl cis-trans isomerase [Steroidobacteraceae bacterium]|nr:FKBP-type peptidyl-prolyl cis-trans isomerase [Steroidobacteraceae bacterium]
MASHTLRHCAYGITFGLVAACGGKSPDTITSPTSPAVATSVDAPATYGPNVLEIGELQPGAGAPITAGQKAVVQYTGWLYETSAPDKKGKEFDSSRNSGQPFSFVVGSGQVIKGWDQGVLGMKVGGRRRLTIPADLAYGDVGAGVIPPGATLVFEVDLVGIE